MLWSYDAPEPDKTISVDFGHVELGKTNVKSIRIINASYREQIYEARRDSKTNPLDYVFDFRAYTWILAPKQTFPCEITYRPFVPFSINTDYFTIIDSCGTCTRIVLRGTCVVPKVSLSMTKLFLYCSTENTEVRSRIKIKNTSTVKAIFMFDIDEKCRTFRLDITHSHVEPRTDKYITITFRPTKQGFYAYHLPCLILHQDPIVVELYGYCGQMKFKEIDDSRLCSSPRIMKMGFERYMGDNIGTKLVTPLVSLSKNFFDFGQINVEVNTQGKTQVICLTNHASFDVSIKWERDNEGIFIITPRVSPVQAGKSALFEIRFEPNAECNLFAREILGFVRKEIRCSQQEEYIAFPFITSVRAIGCSFPPGSNGWIPQYELPPSIVMPPCLPPFPVYTTFLIKKFGHLPLMFRFVPPPSTRFFVKPMMGLIRQHFCIIAVEMVPKPEDAKIYVERWAIYFNGNPKNENFIDFKGYAEYANITFDTDTINFGSVYPGCQQVQRISMRNVSRHTIKYEFLELPPELEIRPSNGTINSNEILRQEWIFWPGKTGDYKFNVRCALTVTRNGVLIGIKKYVNLGVVGKSIHGFLIAIPDELKFGIQEYASTKELSFHVFNCSEISIYFKIICAHINWPLGCIQEDVVIYPISATVHAGEDERITVSVTPHTVGYYELMISYLVRVSSYVDSLIHHQSRRDICKVNCMCILPTFKIKDLYYDGFDPSVSKVGLWKTMHINTLNKMLNTIQPGEKKTLHIKFDPIVLNEKCVNIKLIVINQSHLNVTWVLKRVRQCSCQPVLKSRGISFRSIDYDCIHKKISSFHPKSGMLKPTEETAITVELRYILLGSTETKWDLDIGHDRHVFLNMLIECLSQSEERLHTLRGTHVKFGMCYFGNRESVCQIHWIHNSTHYDLPFSVNTEAFTNVNRTYRSDIFECVTPSGIVEAYSSKPLLLKFHPRQYGMYKVTLPLTLNDKIIELLITGESSCNCVLNLDKSIPLCSPIKDEGPIVYFSMNYIDIPLIPSHNRSVKMFMLYNNSNYDVLAYEWKRQKVRGIGNVQVYPPKGIIQAKAIQSFRLIVNTLGYPCKIEINVPCKFTNTTERREYQRSILKRDILCKELDGQFVINEKGIKVPTPCLAIPEKPISLYQALTVKCNILGSEDNENCTLGQNLKFIPPYTLSIEDGDTCNIIISKNEADKITFILESILWDILNCKTFKSTLGEVLTSSTDLYYSQFVMGPRKREQLIRRSYISPPRMLIESVLEKMLFIIVHEDFGLDTMHLMHDEDARYLNHLKISSRKHPTIALSESMYHLGDKEKLDIMKLGSTVMFIE